MTEVTLSIQWYFKEEDTVQLYLGGCHIFAGEIWRRDRLGNKWSHSFQNPVESVTYDSLEEAKAALLLLLQQGHMT